MLTDHHNFFLEETDSRLRIPSVCKASSIALGISFVILAAGIGFFFEWKREPDFLDTVGESAEWRVMSADGVAKDWRICSLQLFTDSECDGLPIDLKKATALSSSTVPAGFQDGTCDSVWSSGADAVSPYIGWSLPASIEVGCMKVLPFQNATDWSCTWSWLCDLSDRCDKFQCASCCDRQTKSYTVDSVFLQAKQDGKWRTLREARYADYTELTTASDYPQDNDSKIYVLVATILFLVFGGIALLLITPIVLCAIVSTGRKMTAMQEKVDAGAGCICNAENAQWSAFVEEQWGPNGAVRNAQHGPIMTLAIGIAIGVLATALLKFRAMLRNMDVSWFWAFVICIPLGIVISFLQWAVAKRQRRSRYNKCRRSKFPIIFGPESLYFGGVFVPSHVVLTRFVRSATNSGCCVEVTYLLSGKQDQKRKVTAPIAEERLAEAKAYVLRHKAFYKVQVTAATAP